MVKVRLHGTPEEVTAFADYLESLSPCVKVLQRSGACADRGKSLYVRVYMDVELANVEIMLEELEKIKTHG